MRSLTSKLERDNRLLPAEHSDTSKCSNLSLECVLLYYHSNGLKIKIRGKQMQDIERILIYPNFPENIVKSQRHLDRYFKFITKDGVNKSISQSEIDNYTEKGWVVGKSYIVKSHSTLGKHWVNNSSKNKLVTDVTTWVKRGWKEGQLMRKDSKTTKDFKGIYKNNVQKYVSAEKLDSFLNDGWIKGSKNACKKN